MDKISHFRMNYSPTCYYYYTVAIRLHLLSAINPEINREFCPFLENFPSVNDYRNPLVASAMKTLGYVNMFNRGISQVQTDLKENGNKPALFDVSMLTAFLVTVINMGRKHWVHVVLLNVPC